MPATARQIERHYTEEPEEPGGMVCPDCHGTGDVMIAHCSLCDSPFETCPTCSGTGTVPVDGSDAADVAGDRLYDARTGA